MFIEHYVTKINNHKQLEKGPNLQKVEESIIRCRGRLKNAPMEYDAKYPIILRKKSKFNEFVVKHYHKLVFHNGVPETLNQIRTKLWIKIQKITSEELLRNVSFAIAMKEIHFSIMHLLICHRIGWVTSLHFHIA